MRRAQGSGIYAPLLIGMGGFTDGFALLLASGAILTLVQYFHLSSEYTGMIVSAPFIGSIAGAIAFGRLGDYLGRKAVFLNVLAFFVAGSLLSALAPSPLVLLISRFMVGVGIGGDIPVSGSLLAEISSRENRGRLIAIQSLLWGVGGVAAALAALLLLPLGLDSWRYVLGIGAVPPLIVLILRREIPESEVWSALRKAPQRPQNLNRERYTKKLAFAAFSLFAWTFILAIFASYTPSFLVRSEGLSKTAALFIGGLQWIGFIAGSGLTFKYADKAGRRALIISSSAALAALLALGYFAAKLSVAVFVADVSAIWIVGGVGYTISSIYSNELFPTILRSTSSGVCFASGRLGGYVSTLIFPIALAAVGISPVLLLLTPLPLAVGLVSAASAPKSERKNLEELERELFKLSDGLSA